MPAKHYVALDSWRGIAALLVVVHHFTTTGALSNSLAIRNAWLFVDFFFVLSGFIIAANYRDRLQSGVAIGRFMLLRLGRLYPLHLFMLLLWITAEAAIAVFASGLTTGGRGAFSGATPASAIPAQFFLLQSIGLGFNETWNWVAWSISTELWTYLVFAGLALGGAARLDRRLAVLAGAMALFILVAPPGSGIALRWLDLARCIYGFCAGALIFSVTQRWQPRRVTRATALEAGAIGLTALFVLSAGALPGGATVVHLFAPLAFGSAVLVFAYDRGAISRALAIPLFSRLGLLSYSVYMIHPFLQLRVLKPLGLAVQKVTGLPLFATVTRSDGVAVQAWGAHPLIGDLATLAMLALVIAAAGLTYRFIEAPGRALARRWADGRPEPEPRPAPLA